MTPDTTELIREARQRIDRYGWWQGDYYPLGADWRDTCACPSGALYIAAGFDPGDPFNIPTSEHWRISDAVNDIQLTLERRGYPYALTTWNDAPNRTKAEVLDLLAEAAREAGQ